MKGEGWWRRRWVVPVTIVLAAALGAGGALVLRRVQTPPAHTRLADQLAEGLLAPYPGPHWKPSARPPFPSLEQPPQMVSLAGLVDISRFWTSPSSPAAVHAWAGDHLPPGTHPELGGHSGRTIDYDGFQVENPPPGVAYEMVLVTTVPLVTGGAGIRIDAQVVVSPDRPGWEHVPQGEQAVTVTAAWQAVRSGRLSHTFHDRGVISKLTAMVNRMPISVVTKTSCPSDEGELTWTVRFSGQGAPVTVQSDACEFTSFSRGSRKGPVLATDYPMLQEEARLLGTTVESVNNRVADASIVRPGDKGPRTPPSPTTTG